MRNNSKAETIKRNYVQVYRHYIEEYEQVKQGLHPQWRRVGEFFAAHRIQRQTFLKYYGRWRNNGQDLAAAGYNFRLLLKWLRLFLHQILAALSIAPAAPAQPKSA